MSMFTYVIAYTVLSLVYVFLLFMSNRFRYIDIKRCLKLIGMSYTAIVFIAIAFTEIMPLILGLLNLET